MCRQAVLVFVRCSIHVGGVTSVRCIFVIVINEVLFFIDLRFLMMLIHYLRDSRLEIHRSLVGKVYITIPSHASSGRNQVTDDNIFLETAQLISTTSNGGICQDLGRLLE